MDFNSSLQNDHAKKFNKLCVFKELHTKKISKDLNNNDQEKEKENRFDTKNKHMSDNFVININENKNDEWNFVINDNKIDEKINININSHSIMNQNMYTDDKQKGNLLFKQNKSNFLLNPNVNNINFNNTSSLNNNRLFPNNKLLSGNYKKSQETYNLNDLERDLNLNSNVITDKIFELCRGQFHSILTCYNGSKLIQKSIDKNTLKINELILSEVRIFNIR